jgi:hypothetical protein
MFSNLLQDFWNEIKNQQWKEMLTLKPQQEKHGDFGYEKRWHQ